MNLPVALTLLRIFIVPLLVALLLTKGKNMDLWAVAVFLIAACTDLLDGYLARKRSQVTTLGILLDPIADKLLISAAFISLVELHMVPAWMVVIIVGREFAVSGLREISSAEGFALGASELGKTKMVMQVIAVVVIVLGQRYGVLHLWGRILLWLVLLFALASAAQYFGDFWRNLPGARKAARRLQVLRAIEEGRKGKDGATQ